jgi:endo-beta-N-acetylglucosaminidase D
LGHHRFDLGILNMLKGRGRIIPKLVNVLAVIAQREQAAAEELQRQAALESANTALIDAALSAIQQQENPVVALERLENNVVNQDNVGVQNPENLVNLEVQGPVNLENQASVVLENQENALNQENNQQQENLVVALERLESNVVNEDNVGVQNPENLVNLEVQGPANLENQASVVLENQENALNQENNQQQENPVIALERLENNVVNEDNVGVQNQKKLEAQAQKNKKNNNKRQSRDEDR